MFNFIFRHFYTIVHYFLKEALEKILELLIGYAKRSQENVGEFTIYF